ncbi:hypothetical protein MNBD_GAMMA11-426 [hydrothermal vent metagenome]|uniref:Uncharacterized protein n=1 Tax=hydrothermal vent metagenome TaxID=652676 RepID=A0A3B0XDU8_9ZZZZ
MELFVPPEYKFIQRRVIDKINVNIDDQDRVLDFRDTADVFLIILIIPEVVA